LLSWLPDRLGPERTAALAAAGHASGLAILALAHSLPVALAAAVVQGVGYSLLFPALALLAVQRVGEQSRGAALGFFTAFFDAGMGLGAPFAGAMAVVLGYGGMFVIAALLSLAGAALTLSGTGTRLVESRAA
jgi:MFS family permease